MTYIYVIRPTRENFRQTITDPEMEIIHRHFDYLKSAFDAGKVSFVGRCHDATFGMCLFEADDMTAAEAWADAEPAVAGGVFSVEVREFLVILKK